MPFRNISEDSFEELVSIASQTRIVSYIWVSGFVFLVCDTLCTLPREVDYIWRSNWSLPKVLYFFIRYWSLVQTLVSMLEHSLLQNSVKRCQLFIWFSLSGGSTTILLLAVHIILGVRLHALYRRDGKVLIAVYLLVFGEVIVQVYLGLTFGAGAIATLVLAPKDVPILGCLTSPPIGHGVAASVVTPVASVLYFVMMAVKVYGSVAQAKSEGLRPKLTPVLHTFAFDGTLYFFLLFLSLVAGGLDALLVQGALGGILSPWNIVAFTFAGTRLILNLREAANTEPSISESIFARLEMNC